MWQRIEIPRWSPRTRRLPPRCRRQPRGGGSACPALFRSCALVRAPALSGRRRQRGPDPGGDVRAHPGHSRVRRRKGRVLPDLCRGVHPQPPHFRASRGLARQAFTAQPVRSLDTPFFDGNSIRSALCAPPPPIRRSLSSTATVWPRRLRAPESSCPSSRRRS